jgi:anti-sigma regulatory factor (Ser/Thr protein kinase)
VIAATSSTARSKAASLAFEGFVEPLILRTYCSAEARTSSGVAGGAKLWSVLMLRHMLQTVPSVVVSLQARPPLVLDLPRDGTAAALARGALAEIEEDDEDIADRLAVLTTELVSNAVRHGGGTIRLRVSFDAEAIRVEVQDEGECFVAAEALAIEGTAAGGFGLKIVEALADRWGVDRARGVVWAELDVP